MRVEADVLLAEGLSWAPISSTRLTRARSLADLCSLLARPWGVGARQGVMGRGGEGAAAAAGGGAPTPGGAAIGTRVLGRLHNPGAVNGVPDDSGGVAATINVNRGMEVVGRMSDDAKEAGSMRRRGIGAAKEGRDLTRSSQAFSSSLSEAVDKPVGTPVGGREQGPVAKQGVADGVVRLVRRHPDNSARVDEVSDVTVGSVGNHVPHPSEGSVVVRGGEGASNGSGEEGLAVGADGGHEGAMGEHLEEGPGLSRSGSVAP